MNRTIYRTGRERESQERLRSDSASVLHAASVGLCKMVAASIGVGQSRVNKLIAGGVANPLELLARWMDRLEREGVPAELVDAIPRWLAQRRGGNFVLAEEAETPASELATIASHLEQTATLHAKASRAAADGIDAAEAELLLPLAEKNAENAQAFRQLLADRITSHARLRAAR